MIVKAAFPILDAQLKRLFREYMFSLNHPELAEMQASVGEAPGL